jgi:hypothetical protein
MKTKFILGMASVLLVSQVTLASTDVCQLAKKNISTYAGLSESQIASYQQKINRECELSLLNASLGNTAAEYNLGLSQITVYQSMRYIQRYFFNKGQANNTPVELIYQKLKTDYAKPNSEQSSEIWNNFQVGIKQLDPTVQNRLAGYQFSVENLKTIHKGFYKLSDEKGDFSHEPQPGKIKDPVKNINYWWKFKTTQEGLDAQNIVNELNAAYKKFDLLTNFDATNDPYINLVMSVQPTEDGGLAIHSGDERSNPELLNKLFTFMNEMLNQGLYGQPMIWKNQLLTPAELAYFVQQFYVGVHPFYEGNGRTSRFLQEMILTAFKLPHGSSGDLMDIDVLTNHEKYYQTAMDANFKLLASVQQCFSEYKSLPVSKKDIANYDQSLISYPCRTLK